ncbi:MAG: hypothetical protein IPL98_11880 [Saprospiraceae bacterium]|nr:hypothetical protein [Saprospiraceae bacterium]
MENGITSNVIEENQLVVMGSSLVSGNTKSCGCLAKEVKANKRISNNHSEVTAIILGYKRHAENRGFKWLLSREVVLRIIDKPCFYCLSEPNNIKKTKNSIGNGLVYSGIDRIDSLQDYTIDNTVPCCKLCNYAKSNLTLIEFQEWAIKLGKNAMAVQWSSYACR